MLISFVLLGTLYTLVALFILKRIGFNYFNPHTYYTVNSFIFFVAIPLFQMFFLKMDYSFKGVVFMNSMLAVGFISYSFGFVTFGKRGTSIAHVVLRHFDVRHVPHITLKLHVFFLLLLCFGVFHLLTVKSGFGFISWLSEPRTGYQYYRKGLGHYYTLSLACLNVAFLLWLFFFKPKTKKKLFLTTSFFVFISLFYGAKAIVLGFIIEALLYCNFFIKKIGLFQLTLIGIFGLFFLFLLMSLYFATEQFYLRDYLSYFDHYYNGHLFFRDFNKCFKHVYGAEYLSGLWKYVPRVFYSDKPCSYGIVKYVTEYYYPGAGESGHTPAFGGPVQAYLNFGIFGVILSGFIGGCINSSLYFYFLRYKNFISFVVLSTLMGFSIFPIVGGAMKVFWYLVQFISIMFHSQLIKGAVREHATLS